MLMNSKWYKKTSVNGDITCSRKPRWIALAALAGSLVLPTELMAAQNALKSLSFNQLPGNLLELRLKMENPAEKPNGFTIDNPARIALDFADTRNDLAKRVIPVDAGNVRSINAVEFQGRTRLIVNLNELSPYSTTVDGDDILIRLSSGGGVTPAAASVTPTVVSAAAITGASELRDMHFRRSEDGAGRVTFKLTDPNTPIDIKQIGQKIVIDMREVDVDDALLKRLDVIDFATPIQFIDTYRRGENVRIEIRPTRGVEYEQIAYQSDNHFTLELRPLAEEEVQARKEQNFEGERLSLNFQDIEVRSVLQLLADFTDQNVVVSDSVEGEVTLRLKNVPWDQALDIILKSKGLAMRQNGNVLMVAPADEIAAREQLELESAQKVHKLSKLRTEMIQVNYAKAENIAEVLRAGQSESSGGDSISAGSNEGLLSDRGSASIDERTNTVLITDTAESLEKIHALIAKLDIPVRQVLIESRVVIATDDFNEEMGMRVGLTRYPDNNTSGGYGITSGNLGAVTNVFNQAIGGESDETVEAPDRWNVNLPASNPAGSIGFNFGTLPLGAFLELELSAMEAEGRGEVVSSPRVITANQHEAHIEQGVEIPYLEASSSGAATVSFKKAVLGLVVTPQITPDDRIIMDLTVNKDSVGEYFGAGANQIPTVDTREVSTQVLVDNGATIVLGGIYEQVRQKSTRKVPFLGDLPILGRLFRTDLTRDEKNELLIFVTPKIINDSSESR